ncbi:MAG: phage replisome organizer N-terminal domain-containing protein [bacterium]
MKKKYYWIKLKEDFFSQPYIKKLRKIAGGDTYTIIYLKILLLSVKNNGYIIFQHIEKTLAEELALIFDEDTDNVTVTIEFMRANKLIEQIENENEYLLPDMLSLIGTESDSAKRVREYRERQKNKPINFENQKTLHCNAKVTKCNKNVTPDIDIDKDIRSLPLTPSKEGEEKNERDFFIKIKNIKTFKTYNNNKLLEHLAENYKELALEEAEKIDKKEREKFDDEPKIKDPGAYLLTMLKNIKK